MVFNTGCPKKWDKSMGGNAGTMYPRCPFWFTGLASTIIIPSEQKMVQINGWQCPFRKYHHLVDLLIVVDVLHTLHCEVVLCVWERKVSVLEMFTLWPGPVAGLWASDWLCVCNVQCVRNWGHETIVGCLLSINYCLLSIHYCLLSIVYYLLIIVYCLLFIVYSLLSIVY